MPFVAARHVLDGLDVLVREHSSRPDALVLELVDEQGTTYLHVGDLTPTQARRIGCALLEAAAGVGRGPAGRHPQPTKIGPHGPTQGV